MSDVADELKRTIIVIAAGGDSSRIVVGGVQSELQPSARIPTWVRQRCLATMPFIHEQSHLSLILRVIQDKHPRETPVAIITGPNTHEPISEFIKTSYTGGLQNLVIIQQDSHPVITPDGNVVYWEDGKILKAPDGTAGCLLKLIGSEEYSKWVQAGHKNVFLWFANDIASGMSLPEFMSQFIQSGQKALWFSDNERIDLMERIAAQTDFLQQQKMCADLEDAPGAYFFATDVLKDLLKFADWHKVTKKAPLLSESGHPIEVLKRERFLSDPIWKATVASKSPQSPRAHRKEAETTSPKRNSRSSMVSRMIVDRLFDGLKDLQGNSSINNKYVNVQWNIGERKPGEFLLDKYAILQTITSGGMGIVYICQSPDEDTPIAVKTFKDSIRWNHPDFVQRFRDEANSWITIPPHPNIVTAYEVREIDGRLHILMEYVPGTTLRDRLNEGKLSTEEILRIGLDLCRGVQFIHKQGLIHRDIKPENILLTPSAETKITDFGLAEALEISETREAVGTWQYMAPESLRGEATPSSDVYSIALVLYQMATGVLPFATDGHADASLRRSHWDPSSQSVINSDMSISLNHNILSCLNHQSSTRPSLYELVATLKQDLLKIVPDYVEPDEIPEAQNGMILRANSLAALNKFEEAVAIYEHILHKDPNNKIACTNLTCEFFSRGKYERAARTAFDGLCIPGDTNKSLADELLRMSMIMLDVPPAEISDPEHPEKVTSGYYSTMSAHIAMASGDTQHSMRYATVAMKLDPYNADAYFQRGQCLFNLGLYAESLRILEEGLPLAASPLVTQQFKNLVSRCEGVLQNAVSFYIVKGRRHLELGRDNLAEDTFRKVIAIKPEDANARMSLGVTLLNQNRFEAALKEMDWSVSLDPTSSLAWLNRGLTLLRIADKRADALTSFHRALELDENSYQARNMIAESLRLNGHLDDARTEFEKSLSIEPESGVALMGLIRIHMEKGSPELGLPLSDRGIQLFPNNSAHWETRGDLMVALKRIADGDVCYNIAIKLDSSSFDRIKTKLSSNQSS